MEDLEYLHEADTEPIPGYRLLHPLGRGGFGEVWKCEAPGGLLKAVKFVHGGLHALDDNAPADEELRAIQRVKTIRHPFILTMERVEISKGELIIVMELADKSLGDVLDDQRQAGKPGIPREQLLANLREAAEVLDLMNSRHGLQHLDIKPRNLFLVSDHVKVGDFGLVSSIAASPGKNGSPQLGAITPLYASPEVFRGSMSPHSDQYSLAIVYQELLTGTLPFLGKNSRQLLMQHLQAEPNLEALSATDRAIIGRALSKDPMGRYLSCSELIQTLIAGQPEGVTATTEFVADVTTGRNSQDTRTTRSAKTLQSRTIVARPLPGPPNEQTVGGLVVGDLVSRTQLTEVWNAQTVSGATRVVKVHFSCPSPGDEGVKRLGSFQHSNLLPIDIIQHTPGRLVLSSPPGDRSLRELLTDAQSQGHAGLPRRVLLGLLRPFAAGLLALQQKHDVQHFSLNPRNTFFDGELLQVADFGVAQLVWRLPGHALAKLNSRYSAPELLANQVSARCDQYSLALIYHELLTGALPTFSGRKGEPPRAALERLPASDRPIVARALDPDPANRWPDAVEFFAALEAVANAEESVHVPEGATTQKRPVPDTRRMPTAPLRVEEAVSEVMRTRFGTSLGDELLMERLEGFRKQWSAERIGSDTDPVIFRMAAPQTFWQRWAGQQPTLEVHVRIASEEVATPGGTQSRSQVRMDVHVRQCPADKGGELLKAVGPLLVESMRTHLQVDPCGRKQERVVWHFPLQVCAILPNGSLGLPLDCQGKDISLNGIGFYLPGEVPANERGEIMLQLPKTAQTPQMSIRARIVRKQKCGEGWHEVGAVLLPPDELPEEV